MDVTVARLNRLSNICADIAQVALASIVIPFLVDEFKVGMLSLGLVTSITFWLMSLYLAR